MSSFNINYEVAKKSIHGLFTPRKAKSSVFSFLINQQIALQAIDFHAHPWAR